LICLQRLGEVYAIQGDYKDANTLFAEVLKGCEASTAPISYAHILTDMGELARLQEHFTEAIAYYKQALDVYVRHDPFDEMSQTWTGLGLSLCYINIGQEDEAAEEIRKAVQTQKAILGETNPHTLHTHEQLYMHQNLLPGQLRKENGYGNKYLN
jgi:tetratricopeptide (TPR) repeat protein